MTTNPEVIEIHTRKDLELFRLRVNNGERYFEAHLMNDIDISPKPTVFNPINWEPIGTDVNPFWGCFDGCGHTISGLYINNNASHQGLFGRIINAEVKNLTVEGEVKGKSIIGGLVASARNSAIINCTNQVKCCGKHDVGGICGYAIGGDIDKCMNLAPIEGIQAAGILGGTDISYSFTQYTTIRNSVNEAEVNVLGVLCKQGTSDLAELKKNNYRYNQIGGATQIDKNNRQNGKVILPFQNSLLGIMMEKYPCFSTDEDTEQIISEFIEQDPNPSHINEQGETYLHLLLKNSNIHSTKVLTGIILRLAEKTLIDFGAKDLNGRQAEDILKDPRTGKTYRGLGPVVKLIQAVKKDKDRLRQVQEQDETFSDIGF